MTLLGHLFNVCFQIWGLGPYIIMVKTRPVSGRPTWLVTAHGDGGSGFTSPSEQKNRETWFSKIKCRFYKTPDENIWEFEGSETTKRLKVAGGSLMLRPLPACVTLPVKLLSIRSVEGLAAILPRQSCTNIDKVDNEMLQHAPERLELESLRWGAELHTDCSSNPLTSSDSPRSRAVVQGGLFC